MVSVEETRSKIHSIYSLHHSSPSTSSTRIWREKGRSMRTIRSNLYSGAQSTTTAAATTCSFAASGQPDFSPTPIENLTDSFVDLHLRELASRTALPSLTDNDFLALSHSSFSDYSVCSSDISGELHRLATFNAAPDADHPEDPKSPNSTAADNPSPDREAAESGCDQDPCVSSLLAEEIVESLTPEDLQPTVKICIDGLLSPAAVTKRSAAAKLRFLAKNHSDNRVLIVESGAVPALVPLLRCPDPVVQEHAVTALLNLSLHPENKPVVAAAAGAMKSLIYALKTGTDTAKQNAAAALMSLAMVEENKLTIGACGAIPPLIALLVTGTSRGKKDALTTLYKLCSARQNKERAVKAGAVGPLVGLLAEEVVEGSCGGGGGTGGMVAEKAMVVLSSLAGVEEGKEAIVEEGGIGALVEAVEESSDKGKEFAVAILLQLCADSVRNRGLLVREGGIPPLVALSQAGTARAKHKPLSSIFSTSSKGKPLVSGTTKYMSSNITAETAAKSKKVPAGPKCSVNVKNVSLTTRLELQLDTAAIPPPTPLNLRGYISEFTIHGTVPIPGA